jgi:hypothetical protein
MVKTSYHVSAGDRNVMAGLDRVVQVRMVGKTRGAAYPFGRGSRIFEKLGHHSRLLLLSLDDIYWQGNADRRRLVSDFRACPEAEAPYVVRAIVATIGNALLRLACSR